MQENVVSQQEAIAEKLGVAVLPSTDGRPQDEPGYKAKKAFHDFCIENDVKFEGRE